MKDEFRIHDSFWTPYQDMVADVMLPYQYNVLNDSIPDPDIEKSHSIENFRIAAGESSGEFYGFVFQDSDTAKWIEAVAYSIRNHPDPEMEKKADETIALIGRAQQKDGYLNTYFTVKKPEGKWENLQQCHELYCAGHMIEAGVAYYESTGKRELLDIVCRFADLICSTFGKGEGKREGIPGHPEIELALVRLYRATGKKEYLDTAKYFIDNRGVDPDFYVKEAAKRDWTMWENLKPENTAYLQARKPIREEMDAVGHAVRVVYLYTGAAMVAKETGDESLVKACENMWQSITQRQMYITGGIGSTADLEAFSMDYDLPNDSAYNETCASVGLCFFAEQMLTIENDARYADVMELALYNTVLDGVQLDGQRFFYANPLDVDPKYAGKISRLEHVCPRRPKWYACACCPPNAARMIASVDKYAWRNTDGNIYNDLYISGEYETENGKIAVETKYPYSGTVAYTISGGNTSFAVRNPEWSKNTVVTVNGTKNDVKTTKGYIGFDNLKDGDKVVITFDMTPHFVYANPLIAADQGKVAVKAGPMTYCFEDTDNGDMNLYYIDTEGEITPVAYSGEKVKDIIELKVPAYKIKPMDSLYSGHKPEMEKATLTAIPFPLWGNREEGKMKVWLPAK